MDQEFHNSQFGMSPTSYHTLRFSGTCLLVLLFFLHKLQEHLNKAPSLHRNPFTHHEIHYFGTDNHAILL